MDGVNNNIINIKNKMKDVSINIAVVVLDLVHNDEADIDYFADLEVTKYCKSYNHVDLVAADAD